MRPLHCSSRLTCWPLPPPAVLPPQVFDPAPGSEERVVALTSSEDALSPYCAAQDALVRCVIALTAGAVWAGVLWLVGRRPLAFGNESGIGRLPLHTNGCDC